MPHKPHPTEVVRNVELDYRLIGNRIGARRRYSGFGQEQLAQTVGLSKTHISNIEYGKSIPSLEAVVGIADALETTPDVFFHNKEEAISWL